MATAERLADRFQEHRAHLRAVAYRMLGSGSEAEDAVPLPPVESKDPNARYFHIHEDDQLDEAQLATWIRQASAVPGWIT
jgi:hypothetical protein